MDWRARTRLLTLVSLAVGCRRETSRSALTFTKTVYGATPKTIRIIRCRPGVESARTVPHLMNYSIRLGDTIVSVKSFLRHSQLLCFIPPRYCQHEVLTHRFHRCRKPASCTGRHQLRRQLSVPKGMYTNTNTHTEHRLT